MSLDLIYESIVTRQAVAAAVAAAPPAVTELVIESHRDKTTCIQRFFNL